MRLLIYIIYKKILCEKYVTKNYLIIEVSLFQYERERRCSSYIENLKAFRKLIWAKVTNIDIRFYLKKTEN